MNFNQQVNTGPQACQSQPFVCNYSKNKNTDVHSRTKEKLALVWEACFFLERKLPYFDTQGNGQLSREEFLVVLTQRVAPDSPQRHVTVDEFVAWALGLNADGL